MKIEILEEAGFLQAMRGLSRSFNRDFHKMPSVALGLSSKDGGHNKFLESMMVWVDIEAPRYWWSQFDTYRAGVTKQSDSTMHTLKRKPLEQSNFEKPIDPLYLEVLNSMISANLPIDDIKGALPESFLQGRTVCMNYKAIRHMILQRRTHKLPEWQMFIECMSDQLRFFEYLGIDGI